MHPGVLCAAVSLQRLWFSLAGEEEVGPQPGSLRKTSHFSCYLQELVNLHLAIFVEVHLVQDLVQRVFVNVDIDILWKRGGIGQQKPQTSSAGRP